MKGSWAKAVITKLFYIDRGSHVKKGKRTRKMGLFRGRPWEIQWEQERWG